MSKENKEHKIPVWLQKIQDNSSELELLISGGAIFALFQLSSLLNNLISNLQINVGLPFLNELLIPSQLILKILTIGFILHLIMRGYWLSLVCLNYVFPSGVKWEKLKHKNPFTIKNNERGDLYNEIIKADKLCGIFMYISIACSIIIVGFSIGFIIINVCRGLTGNHVIVEIIHYLFLLYCVDFFLSGFLRKISYLSYILFPFFYLFDFMTLRFITQKSLFLFDTNNRVLKFFLVFVFVTSGFILSIEPLAEQFHWGSIFNKKKTPLVESKERVYFYNGAIFWSLVHYKDEVSFPFYNKASVLIESRKIESNFLELEIVHNVNLDVYCQKNGVSFYENLFEIQINQSVYLNPDWMSWEQPKTRYSGIKTMLDISNLNHGKNMVEIYIGGNLFAKTYFWFDKIKAQKNIK